MLTFFMRRCDGCHQEEERVFTDSWTGKQLCLSCLDRVAQYVTNSPDTEGDNLAQVLRERL